MTRQFSIPGLRQSNAFGGVAAKGKRKERRPVATKRSMHLVLKSSLAVGKFSLHQKGNSQFISELVARLSKKWCVRVYEFSNNGNHLHLLIQPASRQGLQSFMRTLSALVARHVTGARKGKALLKKFWDAIPFTRIVEWGKAFFLTKNYVIQNQLEAAGVVPHAPRNKAVPWQLRRRPKLGEQACAWRPPCLKPTTSPNSTASEIYKSSSSSLPKTA